MLLNNLRNKEQEHTDIKNILEKNYGYTVKDPVSGNSAKKALQQVQDAKQELYRNFNLAEYNRVVLFEQYLKQLIERKVPGRTPTRSKEKTETEKYTLPTLIDPESGKLMSSSGDGKDLKFMYKTDDGKSIDITEILTKNPELAQRFANELNINSAGITTTAGLTAARAAFSGVPSGIYANIGTTVVNAADDSIGWLTKVLGGAKAGVIARTVLKGVSFISLMTHSSDAGDPNEDLAAANFEIARELALKGAFIQATSLYPNVHGGWKDYIKGDPEHQQKVADDAAATAAVTAATAAQIAIDAGDEPGVKNAKTVLAAAVDSIIKTHPDMKGADYTSAQADRVKATLDSDVAATINAIKNQSVGDDKYGLDDPVDYKGRGTGATADPRIAAAATAADAIAAQGYQQADTRGFDDRAAADAIPVTGVDMGAEYSTAQQAQIAAQQATAAATAADAIAAQGYQQADTRGFDDRAAADAIPVTGVDMGAEYSTAQQAQIAAQQATAAATAANAIASADIKYDDQGMMAEPKGRTASPPYVTPQHVTPQHVTPQHVTPQIDVDHAPPGVAIDPQSRDGHHPPGYGIDVKPTATGGIVATPGITTGAGTRDVARDVANTGTITTIAGAPTIARTNVGTNVGTQTRTNTGKGKKGGKKRLPWLPGIPIPGPSGTGAKDRPEPRGQTFGSLGGYGIWPYGKLNSSIKRRGNVMNEEATFKNLKKLLEQDLDQAELALAAKDMVVQLQDIAEDLAKMQVENLMPLVDRIKEEYGPEAGEQFNGSVEAALGSALEGIKGTHEQVQNAVLVLTGDKSAMSTDMGTDDMSMDMGDTDMDDGLGGDDEISLDGADAAAGPENISLGRAVKKESVEKAKRALKTALREGKYNDKVLRQIIKSMK
jgi:hypothetical protein